MIRGILQSKSLYGCDHLPFSSWLSGSHFIIPLGGYMTLSAHLMAINASLWPSDCNSSHTTRCRVQRLAPHNEYNGKLPSLSHYEPFCLPLPISSQRCTIFGILFFFFEQIFKTFEFPYSWNQHMRFFISSLQLRALSHETLGFLSTIDCSSGYSTTPS